MKTLNELENTPHLCITGQIKEMGMLNGWVKWPDFEGTVVISFDDGGFNHVSVSHFNRKRLPSWDVMCRLKEMFFYPEELVVQIHPPESKYLHGVRNVENVLHLWRPKDGDFSRMNTMEEFCEEDKSNY